LRRLPLLLQTAFARFQTNQILIDPDAHRHLWFPSLAMTAPWQHYIEHQPISSASMLPSETRAMTKGLKPSLRTVPFVSSSKFKRTDQTMRAILRLTICLLTPLMLQGCLGNETCLDAAERLGGPLAIKFSKNPEFSGGSELCAGIGHLVNQNNQEARSAFETALEAAPIDQRSIVKGYLARTLAPTEGSTDLAFQYWNDAISGAAKDENLQRENIFRADRGSLHAERKNWDLALTDFRKVYSTSDIPVLKEQAAYYALGAVVGTRSVSGAADWYKKFIAEADKLSDSQKIAQATEIYGQLLDEESMFDHSNKLYNDAIIKVEGRADPFILGELLEFHGQSRFAAGDFSGGEKLYNRAIEAFNDAGRSDYAQHLDQNLQAVRARMNEERRCDLPGVVPSSCN